METLMAARMGEKNNRAKCSDLDIAMAIELVLVHGLSQREVARKFDVVHTTVGRWVNSSRRAIRGLR